HSAWTPGSDQGALARHLQRGGDPRHRGDRLDRPRRVARMHPDADSRRDPGVRLGSSGSAGLHRLIAISYWLLAIRQEPDFGWGDLLPAVLLQRGLPGCLSKAQRADVHTLDPLAEHRIPHRRRVAWAVDSMPWAD